MKIVIIFVILLFLIINAKIIRAGIKIIKFSYFHPGICGENWERVHEATL